MSTKNCAESFFAIWTNQLQNFARINKPGAAAINDMKRTKCFELRSSKRSVSWVSKKDLCCSFFSGNERHTYHTEKTWIYLRCSKIQIG